MVAAYHSIPIAAVLHAYQPPSQDPKILKRIVENCYVPVAEQLVSFPEIKITLNINASLTEQLALDYPHVIAGYEELARNGQVEFLESGAYHPILPLISPKEAAYQIKLNHQINKEVFGNLWAPIGFWPPELAVSYEVIKLVETLGFKYLIIPEIAIRSNSFAPPPLTTHLYYFTQTEDLYLVNRNREISNNISFKRYPALSNAQEHFNSLHRSNPDGTLVWATDIETFGEHHKHYYRFFIELLKLGETKTVSDLLTLPTKAVQEFRSASWSTSEEDLYRGIPFPLWAYPGNAIHDLLNYHGDLISELAEFLLSLTPDETNDDVRHALKAVARAQYSCSTWWASTKDHFSKTMIMKGFNAQNAALLHILEVLDLGSQKSIIIGLSNRLEKRLQKYLALM
ncbi:MAG: hypothetical protein ACFFE8_15290 [Candidatus Heimdallarchaeota archaeon]